MLTPNIRKETNPALLKGKPLGTKKTKASSGDSSVTDTAESSATADTFETTLAEEQLKVRNVTPTRTVHPVEGTFDKKVIATLIGTLETQGEDLIHDPSLKNFARYKSALQNLLETTLPKAYTVIKNYSQAPDSHTHKEYHIIGTVSQELSSLLSLIKETHHDKITLIAKVDAIKGMIINYLK